MLDIQGDSWLYLQETSWSSEREKGAVRAWDVLAFSSLEL